MSINSKNAIPLLLTGAAAYLGVGGEAPADATPLKNTNPVAVAQVTTATEPGIGTGIDSNDGKGMVTYGTDPTTTTTTEPAPDAIVNTPSSEAVNVVDQAPDTTHAVENVTTTTEGGIGTGVDSNDGKGLVTYGTDPTTTTTTVPPPITTGEMSPAVNKLADTNGKEIPLQVKLALGAVAAGTAAAAVKQRRSPSNI